MMRGYVAALGLAGSLMVLWAAIIGIQTAASRGNVWPLIG